MTPDEIEEEFNKRLDELIAQKKTLSEEEWKKKREELKKWRAEEEGKAVLESEQTPKEEKKMTPNEATEKLGKMQGAPIEYNRIRELLAAGANPNTQTKFGQSFLYSLTSSYCGPNKKEVKKLYAELLEHGADPNFPNKDDEDVPLAGAAISGDLDFVKILAEHGANFLGKTSKISWGTDYSTIGELLLDKFKGDKKAIQFIQEKIKEQKEAAEKAEQKVETRTPTQPAPKGEETMTQEEATQRLKDLINSFGNQKTTDKLKEALPEIKSLLKQGADPNVQMKDKDSNEIAAWALMSVADSDVMQLMEGKVDWNTIIYPTNNQWTLAHNAAAHNNKEALEYFAKRGIDLKKKDQEGRTPLDCIWDKKLKAEIEAILPKTEETNVPPEAEKKPEPEKTVDIPDEDLETTMEDKGGKGEEPASETAPDSGKTESEPKPTPEPKKDPKPAPGPKPAPSPKPAPEPEPEKGAETEKNVEVDDETLTPAEEKTVSDDDLNPEELTRDTGTPRSEEELNRIRLNICRLHMLTQMYDPELFKSLIPVMGEDPSKAKEFFKEKPELLAQYKDVLTRIGKTPEGKEIIAGIFPSDYEGPYTPEALIDAIGKINKETLEKTGGKKDGPGMGKRLADALKGATDNFFKNTFEKNHKTAEDFAQDFVFNMLAFPLDMFEIYLTKEYGKEDEKSLLKKIYEEMLKNKDKEAGRSPGGIPGYGPGEGPGYGPGGNGPGENGGQGGNSAPVNVTITNNPTITATGGNTGPINVQGASVSNVGNGDTTVTTGAMTQNADSHSQQTQTGASATTGTVTQTGASATANPTNTATGGQGGTGNGGNATTGTVTQTANPTQTQTAAPTMTANPTQTANPAVNPTITASPQQTAQGGAAKTGAIRQSQDDNSVKGDTVRTDNSINVDGADNVVNQSTPKKSKAKNAQSTSKEISEIKKDFYAKIDALKISDEEKAKRKETFDMLLNQTKMQAKRLDKLINLGPEKIVILESLKFKQRDGTVFDRLKEKARIISKIDADVKLAYRFNSIFKTGQDPFAEENIQGKGKKTSQKVNPKQSER